ncbi:hypothetical protein D4A39_17075, partial [Alcanivorax profundi]
DCLRPVVRIVKPLNLGKISFFLISLSHLRPVMALPVLGFLDFSSSKLFFFIFLEDSCSLVSSFEFILLGIIILLGFLGFYRYNLI